MGILTNVWISGEGGAGGGGGGGSWKELIKRFFLYNFANVTRGF